MKSSELSSGLAARRRRNREPAEAAPLEPAAAPDRIELKQLEQVIEICEAGGISGAARHLGITQPALSKSIAKLEAQLGVQLFDRSGGHVRPTQFGLMIAERGRPLLGSAAALSSDVARLAQGASGRLRIGVGPASTLKPMPEVARAIVARFPALQLDIHQDSGPALMRGMAEGRYELVFGYYESAEPFGDLIRIKIFEDVRVAVVRPGHPALEAKAPLSARQVLRYPIACAGVTPSFSRWAGDLTPAHQANATALVCDDYRVIAHAVASSDLIAWGPRFVFADDLDRGDCVELPITWRSRYECWMLTTETHWRSPLIKAVADLARSPQAPGRRR